MKLNTSQKWLRILNLMENQDTITINNSIDGNKTSEININASNTNQIMLGNASFHKN